jgi:hypothetical protein
MDIFVGVDTFFIRENQVWNFKVYILNLRSFFSDANQSRLLPNKPSLDLLGGIYKLEHSDWFQKCERPDSITKPFIDVNFKYLY